MSVLGTESADLTPEDAHCVLCVSLSSGIRLGGGRVLPLTKDPEEREV